MIRDQLQGHYICTLLHKIDKVHTCNSMLIKYPITLLKILRIPNQPILLDQSKLFGSIELRDHEFLLSPAWLIWLISGSTCPSDNSLLEYGQEELSRDCLSHYDLLVESLYLEEDAIALRSFDIQFESLVLN